MFPDVVCKLGLLYEGFPAVHTCIRGVLQMGPSMRITSALVSEAPGTVGAGVGPLARVAPLVPQHVGALHEPHGAVRARVTRTFVDLDVFTEGIPFHEYLPAVGTGVVLLVRQMILFVHIQGRLVLERLAAFRALERMLTRVTDKVVELSLIHSVQHLAAELALELAGPVRLRHVSTACTRAAELTSAHRAFY